MKEILFIVHVPMFIVGLIFGTIWFGIVGGYKTSIDFWCEK